MLDDEAHRATATTGAAAKIGAAAGFTSVGSASCVIRGDALPGLVTLGGRGALAGLLLLAGCTREPPPDVGTTARAERGRIERVVVATGTIEPEKEVEVRPRISGIVEMVHVRDGDVVAKDALLLEIDRELIEAQAAEARSRLEQTRVELRYAGLDLERARELVRSGTVSTQEHERAEARFKSATAAVARDEAAVDSLAVQLKYTRVLAPMAGKILDVPVENGDAVSAVTAVTGGTLLLVIADPEPLHLKGLVDENEVAHVVVGQAARIRTEAFPARTFRGEVRDIAPLGQRQQNVTYFEVEVLVTDPDAGLLRPRMSADADIVTEAIEDALVVPETALVFEGGDVLVERVVRASDPQVERRKVEVGIVSGARVQVLGGLEPGDEVRLR
jgi:HlyD family secretion protein